MEIINNPNYNHPHFSLQIPAFEDFELKLMSIKTEQVEPSFNKLKDLSKRKEQEDGVLYADIHIVTTYFEKLMAVINGVAEKELFRIINESALNDYRNHPEITSSNLFEVILAALII